MRPRRDAELWLKCGEGSVRTVILIKAEATRNDRGVINHSRRFNCQVWRYGGLERVTRRPARHSCTAEPEFAFSEEFSEGQIRIPFSNLVEERVDNRDHTDFVLTPDDLMTIATDANEAMADSERPRD